MQLMFENDRERNESFALLEELGTMLQVDIQDMLNRSQTRSRTLDAYMEGLIALLRRANAHRERMEQTIDELSSERREMRKSTSAIQRELSQALRAQDYATASRKQQELISAEGELAILETRVDEERSVLRIFEKYLEIGEDRLFAISENREALLAGIKVVEVPGIDDLGLLEQENRRRNSGSEGIFNLDLRDM
jgi:chromosome segregation ATPase